MATFWLIDETPFANLDPAGTPQRSEVDEDRASLLTQMEQALGGKCEPDATFFMDSWTLGMTAASENLLRRQRSPNNRSSETAAWDTSVSFTSFFADRIVMAVQPPPRPGETPARHAPKSGVQLHNGKEQEDGSQMDEGAFSRPLTLDSARRLLAVTGASAREIRVAYRRMASRYHPDRLACRTSGEQKLASDRMASINEAYRLLCAELSGESNTGCGW